jgi:hypothetical protein
VRTSKKAKQTSYQSPHKYTDEELLQHEIEDQITDIRCAIRDGQPEYAKHCEQELVKLRAKLSTLLEVVT